MNFQFIDQFYHKAWGLDRPFWINILILASENNIKKGRYNLKNKL